MMADTEMKDMSLKRNRRDSLLGSGSDGKQQRKEGSEGKPNKGGSTGKGKDKKPSQRKEEEEFPEEPEGEMDLLTAKLALNSIQRVRLLEGAVFRSWLTKLDYHPSTSALKMATSTLEMVIWVFEMAISPTAAILSPSPTACRHTPISRTVSSCYRRSMRFQP